MASRWLVAFLGALLLTAPVGCGIPGYTDVWVDGRGPGSGGRAADGQGNKPPARTDVMDRADAFVANYLLASAGEISTAHERANSYLPPDSRNKLPQPRGNEAEIQIIRLIDSAVTNTEEAATSVVTISVQHIGVLRADGAVGETSITEQKYTFKVGPARKGTAGMTSAGLFLLELPALLLMDEQALDDYYRPHTIYFWSADRAALVPDLRYLPDAIPPQRAATEVLSWMTAGPARWLGPAVVHLPKGTAPIGNVPDPQSNGRLEVNLSVPAEAADDADRLDELFTQLIWSLPSQEPRTVRPRPRELELKIGGKSRKIADIDTHRRSRPLYQLTDDPIGFCLYNGEIQAFGSPDQRKGVQLPIGGAANQGVLSAGLNRDGGRVWAALVVGTDDGRRRLRTAAGPSTLSSGFVTGNKSFAKMSRPVWLKRLKSADPGNPVGLVVADGRLYQFNSRAQLTSVPVPADLDGRLTDVKAALDGQRVALVVNRAELHVAGLAVGQDSVSLGPLRRLTTSLTDLTAVDWYGENALVVAGRNAGQAAINRLRVDATGEVAAIENVGGPVTHLAAYPDNLFRRARETNVLYGTEVAAYSGQEPIKPEQVTDMSEEDPEPELFRPVAPFFYY